MKLVLALLLTASAAAATCPPVAPAGDQTAKLLTDLLKAPSEAAANQAAGGLWEIWLTAPDAEAQRLLDRAIDARRVDLAGSEKLLDDLTVYCPDYPEGFNQRAFTRFLRQDFEGALEDIDTVLERVPHHFGALSGKALTLFALGRDDDAQDVLRRAVRVHPFLRERSLIKEPERL
ncbi:MAG: tetratricopeptide repeat protein [Pseudomonadota bacterium]